MATTPKNRRSPSSGSAPCRSLHQPAVPRLEDLQRQHDAGEQGRPEREQRDELAHEPGSLRPRGAGGRPPACAALATLECSRPTSRRWPVLARIDLRGCRAARDAGARRAAAPGRAPTSTRSWRPSARSARTCASAAPRRSARSPPGSTASTAEDFAVPQEALDRALAECDPALRGGAGGGDPPGAGRARRPAAHRRHHPGGARRHGDRALAAGAAGRALRARRPGAAAVQRGDERGARADRRRRSRSRSPRRRSATTAGCPTRACWPPARCSASPRSTRSAARRRSRCSATARAPASRSTWSPGRATST